MADYKVQFEVFEGPLDLLLYLVRKEEVDIYQVNLTKIATEFIEYIEVMRQLDLDVAGEFLVMAATLMYIKSRELLPEDEKPDDEEEEETEDPRWELIRQLVEYKKFKDAAAKLQLKETHQEEIYHRKPPKPELRTEEEKQRPDVSIFDLIQAVSQVLKRFQERPNPREIYEDKWSVSEKIELLRHKMETESRFRFSELFSSIRERGEVVVTFLALLEMIRLKQLAVVQNEEFGEIEITKALPIASPDELENQIDETGSALSSLDGDPAQN